MLRSRFRPKTGCRTPFRWAGVATTAFLAWDRLLEVRNDLEGELVGLVRRREDRDLWADVREDRLVGARQAILEAEVDPVDGMPGARVRHPHRTQSRHQAGEVHDRREGERLQDLGDARARTVVVVE